MTDQVQLIIAKHLNGESTPDEEVLLRQWLEHEDNRREFEAVKAHWLLTDSLFEQPKFDTAAAWDKVASQTIQSTSTRKTRFISLPAFKIAVAAAAALAIGFFIFQPKATPATSISFTAKGGHQSITLPDQSIIYLREGCTIEYLKNFEGKTREVSLKGDATFKVAHNAKKPFIVHTPQAAVCVLGTQFDITTGKDETLVAVHSGKVSVSDNHQAHSIFLVANQKATIKGDLIEKDTLRNNNQLFWQTQELTFDAQSLDQVLRELSTATHTDIAFDPSTTDNIKQQKITISFKAQQVEEMLTELCLISKCNWQKQGSKYLVRTK